LNTPALPLVLTPCSGTNIIRAPLTFIMPSSSTSPVAGNNNTPGQTPFWQVFLLLSTIMVVLFWRSFSPELVHFSNDGPLGQQNVNWSKLPDAVTGQWDDLNDVGFGAGAYTPSISVLIKFILSPLGYAKFLAPCALLLLGLGAWSFFRSLRLSPLAAILGGIAVMLNSTAFGDACWGTASHQIALGMDFFALALVHGNDQETRWYRKLARLALAGLCVGMNVIEAADIGGIFSVCVAAYVFLKALLEPGSKTVLKVVSGSIRVGIIAVFALIIAIQAVIVLTGFAVQGVASTSQAPENKLQRWDYTTQWSLPKKETVSLLVPGLFGYKMDTPKDMMPALQPYYEGGVYWGGIGRDPNIDRFFDSGKEGTPPQGLMRFSGGGSYAGVLVILVAAWAVTMSFRREGNPLSRPERGLIWFWTALLLISLVLAWGRFAPSFAALYQLLYDHVPYFSTIRNPAKFMAVLSLGLNVLFAYGLHLLSQRHLSANASGALSLGSWWAKCGRFDRRWTQFTVGFLGVSVLAWLIYFSQKTSLVHYIQTVGYGDENFAGQIASFSIGQFGWYVLTLGICVVLLILTWAGHFSGPRAKLGAILLGALLTLDLGRANLPFIIHWDYKQKYEVDSLNPIVKRLCEKPYEHRVTGLPFRAPEGMELLDQVYRIEWMQHHFPYYNIQCLDWIQMSRLQGDLKRYVEALTPKGTPESVPLMTRRWALTNTRYQLGPAGFLEVMNQQLDPQLHRFKIVERFEILPKPGILKPTQYEELTAVSNPEGRYAMFEFTGALPRVKLYGNWPVNTNDEATLNTLANLQFDPFATVLISSPINGRQNINWPATGTNANDGTVEFKSYSPKKLVLTAQATQPSVLLLNDKYEPDWRVTVDGQPAQLLRCNFFMRGVALPPGAHEVIFSYHLSDKPLYFTLTGIGLALLLSGYLLCFKPK
jgi:hypothetical protein